MMQTKFVRAEVKYKPKFNLSDSRATSGRLLERKHGLCLQLTRADNDAN